MGITGSRRPKRIRLATVLPFTAGVFLGTLITLFLVLTLRSIDEDSDAYDGHSTSLKMPSMPRVQPKDLSGTVHLTDQIAPIINADDESKLRELVSYSVVIRKPELKRRGLAAHKTWASGLGKRVSFYLFPPGGDEEIHFAYKRRMPLVSLGTSRGDRTSLRKSQGVFRTWVDVCARDVGKYQWYTKVEDTTYVRPKELEKILVTLNSSEAHFIGHQVIPEGRAREELGMREGEGYCMEMGYVLSARTLQLLCPMLRFCRENARSENEDVEIARCVRLAAGVNCTSAREVLINIIIYNLLLYIPFQVFASFFLQTRELFYKARGLLAEEELQMGEHQLNPSLKKAVLLSPLAQPDHFYHMHYYFVKERLNVTRTAATQLRLHMIHTADMAAESDSYAHTSIHQSPSWTRLGVNAPYRPHSSEDVVHCQSFDSRYKYIESKQYPSHPLSSLVASDLESIVTTVSKKYGVESYPINSILQRVDPQRGIDYFIHALERDSDGEYSSKFMHALREAEPLRVTSLEPANYHTSKVNFVVPTSAVSKGFQRFMISFESTFLARSPPELVGLFVILYSDGQVRKYSKNLFGTTTLLQLYKKKYPDADLRLITTNRPFSRKESIELASKEHPSFELLFLADIHVDFSHQFLERCRMNAVENQQAYFPAVFSPYNPSEFYRDRVLHPYAIRFRINEDQGSWMHENFHLACMYNYDLEQVLAAGRGLKQREWSLIELVLRYQRLHVFRAVEPGLVHLWQDGCSEEQLGSRERTLCRNLGMASEE